MGAFLRKDKAEIAKDMEYIFSLFPILKERRHQQGGTLSGGEQQMLAISRALMARPRLLLLDEPSLGLAPLIVQLIFQIIRQINEESATTILLVEQNANMALQIAHRGYVMENGRITLEGTAGEPPEQRRREAGLSRIVERSADRGTIGSTAFFSSHRQTIPSRAFAFVKKRIRPFYKCIHGVIMAHEGSADRNGDMQFVALQGKV